MRRKYPMFLLPIISVPHNEFCTNDKGHFALIEVELGSFISRFIHRTKFKPVTSNNKYFRNISFSFKFHHSIHQNVGKKYSERKTIYRKSSYRYKKKLFIEFQCSQIVLFEREIIIRTNTCCVVNWISVSLMFCVSKGKGLLDQSYRCHEINEISADVVADRVT